MSLTEPELATTVKRQMRFKLKMFSGMVTTLLLMQVVGLLLSLSSMNHFSGDALSIDYYAADVVVVFTMLWGFISAIQIKTKGFREDDFVFVTSRLTSDLANIGFLALTSLLGGITAILSGFLLKVIVYFLFDSITIIQTGFTNTPFELLTGILAAALFILMTSSLGYLIGTFVHLHKMFAYIIPVAAIGLLYLWPQITQQIGTFYFQEGTFWLAACKVIATSGVLLSISMMIARRLEVRT